MQPITTPLLVLGLLVAAIPASAQLVPAGPEFQVNSHTPLQQTAPDVGRDAAGNFIVVWESDSSPGNDTSSSSIVGRRFQVDGSPNGDDFQVNTTTLSGQRKPKVAVTSDGGFVVVWQSYSAPPSFARGGVEEGFPTTVAIVGRRFDSDGMPIGGDFRVNTLGNGNRFYPDVAIDGSGAFIVVWSGITATDPSIGQWGVAGRLYDSGGVGIGDEFTLHTVTDDTQDAPAVAMSEAGAFTAVWESDFAGNQSDEIRGQRFDSSGMPLGSEFQVNSFSTYSQEAPDIALNSDGGFIVTWDAGYGGSPGNDTGASIVARRFASSGAAIGNDFQVNTYTTGFQYRSTVTTDTDGSFVIAWTSPGSFGDDTGYSVQARRFAANGAPSGAEFQVNGYTTNNQALPSATFLEAGHLVVVWSSYGSHGGDSSGYGILAQRFGPPEIFDDGFESGDLSLWSGSVP